VKHKNKPKTAEGEKQMKVEGNSKGVNEIITDRIIRSLEQDVIPWQKPWSGGGSWPRNLVTKKQYRGINVLLLACQEFGSPYWLTYNQTAARSGQVKKGEKATPIVFWQVKDRDHSEAYGRDDKQEKMFVLRYYNVFNVEQTTLEVPREAPGQKIEPIAACVAVLDDWQQKPQLRMDNRFENKASYSPTLDAIQMPVIERFHSAEHYYVTLFHELVHSTGHPSRLNRLGVANFDRFGSEQYSKEELIAECGAAFLCGHTGIANESVERNATAYLQNWIAALRGDSRLIVSAASQAQRAVDMILNQSVVEEAMIADGANNLPKAPSLR
jgi:antirestriction protein ArdC